MAWDVFPLTTKCIIEPIWPMLQNVSKTLMNMYMYIVQEWCFISLLSLPSLPLDIVGITVLGEYSLTELIPLKNKININENGTLITTFIQ